MSREIHLKKLAKLASSIEEMAKRLNNSNKKQLSALELDWLENKLINLYDFVLETKSQTSKSKTKPVKKEEKKSSEINVPVEVLKEVKKEEPVKKSKEKAKAFESLDKSSNEELEDLLKEAENLMNERKFVQKESHQQTNSKRQKEEPQKSDAKNRAKESENPTIQDEQPAEQLEYEVKNNISSSTLEKKENVAAPTNSVIEKKGSLNDQFTPSKTSLLDKLNLQKNKQRSQVTQQMAGKPIKDLKKAINLNLQIRYQRELFDNDKRALKRAIEFINKCHTYSEARSYLQVEVADNFPNCTEENPHFIHFMGLVKRRFI